MNEIPTYKIMMDDMVVGILYFDDPYWHFSYTEMFKRQNRIAPIVNFPNKNQEYVSKYLWPFFTDRIPGKGQRQMMKETETSQVKLLQKYGRESIMNPFLVLFMVGMGILAINSLLKE